MDERDVVRDLVAKLIEAVEASLDGSPAVRGALDDERRQGRDQRTTREPTLDAHVVVERETFRLDLDLRIDAGEDLAADVVLSEVGEPQEITIPAGGGFKPIGNLLASLQELGVSP